MKIGKVGSALVCASLMALAAPAQMVSANVDPAGPVLRWGTPVALTTTREISSKSVALGQRVNLEVADNVMVAGRVVIPRGTAAVAEIAAVKPASSWGKRGRLKLRLLYVHVGDQNVRLTGDLGSAGHSGVPGTAAMVVAVGVLGGFIITGTSAVVPVGTGLNGYVDEDVPIAFGRVPVRTAAVVPDDASAAMVVPTGFVIDR